MPTVPRATVGRLPLYLQFLDQLPVDRGRLSSQEIAAGTSLSAAQVRRDLSHFGALGTRGVGYDRQRLRDLLHRELGLTHTVPVAIVGAGNLGSALAGYPGFIVRGFRLVGLYDIDRAKVGTAVGRLTVRHLEQLSTDVSEEGIALAIIATPGEAALNLAERLVRMGVRGILNFAPITLKVPGARIHNVDLSNELQILSFYLGKS